MSEPGEESNPKAGSPAPLIFANTAYQELADRLVDMGLRNLLIGIPAGDALSIASEAVDFVIVLRKSAAETS